MDYLIGGYEGSVDSLQNAGVVSAPIAGEEFDYLEKIFTFDNYEKAVAFSNDVAALAEIEDHHPLIILEWGKVTVKWWSHKINGLHKNDFICAAKTDLLAK